MHYGVTLEIDTAFLVLYDYECHECLPWMPWIIHLNKYHLKHTEFSAQVSYKVPESLKSLTLEHNI